MHGLWEYDLRVVCWIPPFEVRIRCRRAEMIINSNVIWPTVDVAAAHIATAAGETGGESDFVDEDDESSSRRGSMWGVKVTPSYLSSSTKDLITGLLEKDPTQTRCSHRHERPFR